MIPRSEELAAGRQWVIGLPAGTPLLSSNGREHWAARARQTASLRETAGWLARAQKIPRLERAHVLATYHPPDRRRRDPANLYPSVKALVDGLTDAGAWIDDDAAHVSGPDMRLGEVVPRGRLVLTITELPRENP
jgi:crossover junction endodeoxyribonuclease RusA